jgi:hypothetical protein
MVAPTPKQPRPQNVFDELPAEAREFYVAGIEVLESAGLPFLVGGAYAMASYAGIVRHTKDFDVFLRRAHVEPALAAFERAGYRTERTHPHWVVKAFSSSHADADFIDLIFGGGNGLTVVDDDWFKHSVGGELFDRKLHLCPAEEIIWSKSSVMDRNRFDGADVAHLLVARGDHLDWRRLQRRFMGHERVLLAHLLMFGYIYPTEKHRVPQRVIDELFEKTRSEPPVRRPICRGTFFSWNQYLPDIIERGYEDARLAPDGPLTQDQVDRWTAATK